MKDQDIFPLLATNTRNTRNSLTDNIIDDISLVTTDTVNDENESESYLLRLVEAKTISTAKSFSASNGLQILFSAFFAGLGLIAIYPPTHNLMKDKPDGEKFYAISATLISSFIFFYYFNNDFFNRFKLPFSSFLKKHNIQLKKTNILTKLVLFSVSFGSAVPLAIPIPDKSDRVLDGVALIPIITAQVINFGAINLFAYLEMFTFFQNRLRSPSLSEKLQRDLVSEMRANIHKFEKDLCLRSDETSVANLNANAVIEIMLSKNDEIRGEYQIPKATYIVTQFLFQSITQITNIGFFDNTVRGLMEFGLSKKLSIFSSVFLTLPLCALTAFISKTNVDFICKIYLMIRNKTFFSELPIQLKLTKHFSSIVGLLLFGMVVYSWPPVVDLLETAILTNYSDESSPIFAFLSPLSTYSKILCAIGTVWYNSLPIPSAVTATAHVKIKIASLANEFRFFQNTTSDRINAQNLNILDIMDATTNELEIVSSTSAHNIIKEHIEKYEEKRSNADTSTPLLARFELIKELYHTSDEARSVLSEARLETFSSRSQCVIL